MVWWQEAVFYQIYPRSFADANGDGIGDVRGIINKLDYLAWLGIDAIWLSPHYPSPQVDVGYDVANYVDVNPEYGTVDDFREFLAEAHKRNIKVILDFVLNHTSDQHQWFLDSKSSRDNPKRDWYIWRDGKDGQPPNNWEAIFGGSAWQYDETTQQYYYHYFLKEQPDLNWRNPAVHQAMFDAMRFWLDMGVDGLRLDAIGTIYEDPTLTPHNSPYTAFDVLKFYWLGKDNVEKNDEGELNKLFRYQTDLPEIHNLMQELRKMADDYPACFLVGETSDMSFLGNGTNQLHSVFNFDLLLEKRLYPEAIRKSQARWQKNLPKGAWQSNTLNNHDQSRTVTHYAGDGKHKFELAKLSAALVLTLEGIPFLYYGEEIGMEDYAIQRFEDIRDLVSNVYRDLMQREGHTDEQILKDLAVFSRDRCRTPMQWDNSPNAGFSPETITTWLPVHENYRQGINVAEQEKDATSLLHLFHDLIHCRKDNIALRTGEYQAVDTDQNDYLAFLRQSPEQTCLILLNFAETEATVTYHTTGKVLLSSTKRTGTIDTNQLTLNPFEILILEI